MHIPTLCLNQHDNTPSHRLSLSSFNVFSGSLDLLPAAFVNGRQAEESHHYESGNRQSRSVGVAYEILVVVAKSWNSIPPNSLQNLPKVFVSLDPLRPEDPSSLQKLSTLAALPPCDWMSQGLVVEITLCSRGRTMEPAYVGGHVHGFV
ncbi:hypothetical protein E3N88_07268 [Mikania micrantha]|uniref:Uncharacterized protein n=1 Tax=Mikania micrantha TaxID=192012 RepID=A0A5N6PS41_9ASTR|nr:hypothetical protein E3N88_07268 [Mikania micrantha]